MGLSGKQRIWLEEYLRCWNATEAARRAGYRIPRVSGPRNLQKPEVAAVIQARIAEAAMGADEVLLRLAEQARGSAADVLTIGPRGRVQIDLRKAEQIGKLHLVKKVRRTRHGLEIELYDAQVALQLIGRHLRLFGEVNLNVDLTKLTDDQLERIARGEDPLVVAATPGKGRVGAPPADGLPEGGPAVP